MDSEKFDSQYSIKNKIEQTENTSTGKEYMTSPRMYINTSNNLNQQLENIKEEVDSEALSKNVKNAQNILVGDLKMKSSLNLLHSNILNESDQPSFNRDNLRHKTFISGNIKENKLSTRDNLISVDDFEEQQNEFLEKMEENEEERNEKRFKKIFTMKGKFTSLAKEKCNKFN